MSEVKWKVLIADDEPAARRGVRQLLAGYPEFEVAGECRNGEEVISALSESPADVLFLDIQMPGIGGFEAIAQCDVRRLPAIVFLTAYDQFALLAFEVEAVDYLVKPVSMERFSATVERLVRRLSVNRPEAGSFMVTTSKGVERVRVADIDWVEAAGNYARVWVGGKGYFLRESLDGLSSRLHDHGFRRAHRSALVRVANIGELRRNGKGVLEAVLVSGVRVPISRRRRAEFLEAVKLRAGS